MSDHPKLTWHWQDGWCYILLDGKEVAHGTTLADALTMLAEQLRRAEREQRAQKVGE